jgi:hypothetical protein
VLAAGVYAIVETSKYLAAPHLQEMSELFVPICKDSGKLHQGHVVNAIYYLATVDAFMSPTIVILDIGGWANDYLLLKEREIWKEDFINWLEDGEEDSISVEPDSDSEDEAPPCSRCFGAKLG